MILLKDNSKILDEYRNNPIIKELIDRDLRDLEKENFIIFPPTIKESIDLESNSYLFKSYNRHTYTGNLIGILKKGNDEIRISSRFYHSHNNSEDYFIRYLLQKIMHTNISQNKINSDSKFSYYDLLIYLFPLYLDNALQKGLYKEYISKRYNDSNIKGAISVARHIKVNTPYMGKIAYNTREFSYDNMLTQLIRHTIEKIQMEYKFNTVTDSRLNENMSTIINATSTYSKSKRIGVLKENILNPVRHGYFEEYYLLQQLCIQILREEKIGYGHNNEEVYGIIIDIAWLWEEYLATLIPNNYTHAENKTGKNPIYFYTNKRSPRYPDFYSDRVVLDAKYKILEKKGLSREDLYQITSYLHVRKAESAGVIFPSIIDVGYQFIGELAGFGGAIFKLGIKIPQQQSTYFNFVEEMEQSERLFLKELK